MPIIVPKDLKCTIAKDRKEVAAIDDAQEATAFNIDLLRPSIASKHMIIFGLMLFIISCTDLLRQPTMQS